MEKSYKIPGEEERIFFRSLLGDKGLSWSDDDLMKYGSDHTEDIVSLPSIVLFPETSEQISSILSYCQNQNIAVTPRGAGTGLSGGSIPLYSGVSLSVERMNKILDIDERNFQVTVQPGVITQVLQEAVEEKGLFYPPDPASKCSCFSAGNIAENSGGPKAVKYGVTKDYVLNLEVVLVGGEVIWTGANVLKNSTGYNLTQLLIGSEGTLGVITKAVLRLIPKPRYDLLILVPFRSGEAACKAVADIFYKGITPSGLEFMERDALLIGSKFLKTDALAIEDDIEAHLLIEVDGNNEEDLVRDMELIHQVLENYDCGDILFADSAAQKEKLWKMRRCLGEAVKSESIYKEEDTVVPRAELPKLLSGVKAIGKKYGFRSVCYGHAGDGNLHVNILKDDLSDETWNHTIKKGIREIFELCVKLGGTISGEHGIGLVQKEYLNIAFDENQMEIQRRIKRVFDPKQILNPGKVL
ncbi:MAG: FAD-linked oxidase C-terminal domain-containing protein [Vicingaceae bacterium]